MCVSVCNKYHFVSQELEAPFPVGLEPFYTRDLQPASRAIVRIDSETRQRNHDTSLIFTICVHSFFLPLCLETVVCFDLD